MSTAPGHPRQARAAARAGDVAAPVGRQRRALVMAGGTGGHIFPGLAVAHALRARGWSVSWLGGKGAAGRPSMESQLVPPQGFAFESLDFSGVRGKGPLTLAVLPLRLLRAFWQSIQVIRRLRPQVVVGLGGYITFPGGMMAVLLGKPLLLHEQNAIAGLSNRTLARVADKVLTAFPETLPRATWCGNPVRREIAALPPPALRYAGRVGRLRLLVLGGSLGAQALNEVLPKALAMLPFALRPQVTHQSGAKQIEQLRAGYAQANVVADARPFIDDMAAAYGAADLVICRAGAMTVAEVACAGVAALFVPFPYAVDDHQTANAAFLSAQGAALLVQQRDLNPAMLADMLKDLTRERCLGLAQQARALAKPGAAEIVARACIDLAEHS